MAGVISGNYNKQYSLILAIRSLCVRTVIHINPVTPMGNDLATIIT
jgi:hypothetical protein